MGELVDLGDLAPLDRTTLVQNAYDYLDANLPDGYTARTGALDDLLINADAQQLSEIAALLSEFGNAVFRYFGLKVEKLAPIDAVPATALTTWTAPDTLGHLIPAGTELSIAGVGFATTTDATIPNASSSVTNVPIVALTAGTVGNDLTSDPDVRDQLDVTYTVALQAATANGQDPEDDDTYARRLVDVLQDLSDAAIVTNDFVRKTLFVAGVGRCLALNHHNGDTNTDGQPGCITLFPGGAAGLATTADTKAAIAALFDEDRVLPLQLFVNDSSYNTIDIAAQVEYFPGFEEATVIGQVEQLLTDFLDPLVWGLAQAGEGTAVPSNDNTVSFLQTAGVIERADGVRRVVTGTLTINGSATDHPMTGIAPLPQVGTLTITAVPIS